MPERDDFYVGYLALPRAHKRFLQVALPLVDDFLSVRNLQSIRQLAVALEQGTGRSPGRRPALSA